MYYIVCGGRAQGCTVYGVVLRDAHCTESSTCVTADIKTIENHGCVVNIAREVLAIRCQRH